MKGSRFSRFAEQGFSLLEVLVAFAILAISMGILFQSYSTGVRGVTLSREYAKATELAQSQLAQVGSAIPLQDGTLSGEWADQYQWTVAIRRASELQRPDPVYALYSVDIRVGWREGERQRSVDLSTLKLGPGPS